MRTTSTSSTRTYMPVAPEPVEPPKPKRPKRKLRLKLPAMSKRRLPWILFAVAGLLCIFLLVQYNAAQNKIDSGDEYYAAQGERLGELILLPSETPTYVGVKDASKLKSQAFYVNAENGDITFVYNELKKAILYRPSQNIIVNVAPINVTPNPSP